MVWRDGTLLLIERQKPPHGFAPPAGHVDGDTSFEDAAKRELSEEVGFTTEHLNLLAEGRKENPCRRQDGAWHYWKIYQVDVSGTLKRSENETKRAGFHSLSDIRELAQRTEDYLSGKISENDWETSPGLEPIWYEWFSELDILRA